MTSPKKVAVIGGGWAGLSCAAHLIGLHRNHPRAQGLEVHLFESAPQLGGRARGLAWPITPDTTLAIDNGQHLTIGAYTETFHLLKLVNAPSWQREPLRWSGVEQNRVAYQWSVPSDAWPWRLLKGIVPGNGPKGWPVAWKRNMPRLLWALTRRNAEKTSLTALTWLQHHGVREDFIDHLWRPLVEGALNTELSNASASVMVRVLRDSLLGPANATDVLTPATDLSQAGVEPIADWLAQHHVRLSLGHRVRRLTPQPPNQDAVARPQHGRFELSIDHQGQQQGFEADRVVMALPARETTTLWQESRLPQAPAIHRLETLRYRAITTIWIALTEEDNATLTSLPSWFVLQPQDGIPHVAQVGVKRPGILALVISAQDPQAPETLARRETHGPLLRDQLRIQLGLALKDQPQKWITEKAATWACTPQTKFADRSEARGLTGVDGLFRCADDLEPGYPATIESAVRSGKRTAETVIASMSD